MFWNNFVEPMIALLRTNATLVSLVDSNFYGEKVRPEINSPYIVFYKAEEQIERFLKCQAEPIGYLVTCTVTFEIVTNERVSNETGLTILNELINTVNTRRVVITGWKDKMIRLISTSNFPEKNLWINSVNFRVVYCSY